MKIERKDLIRYLLLLAVFAVIIFVFFCPNLNKLIKIEDTFSAKLKNLENRLTDKNSTIGQTEEMRSLKSQFPDLNKLFYQEGDELSLITKLEEFAASNDLEQMISLNPKIEMLADNLKVIAISLKVDGSFINFLNYLQQLKTLNHQLTIENFDIMVSGNEMISANFYGKTFWLINK